MSVASLIEEQNARYRAVLERMRQTNSQPVLTSHGLMPHNGVTPETPANA